MFSHVITLASGSPSSVPMAISERIPRNVRVIGAHVTAERTSIAASRVTTRTGRRPAGAPRSAHAMSPRQHDASLQRRARQWLNCGAAPNGWSLARTPGDPGGPQGHHPAARAPHVGSWTIWSNRSLKGRLGCSCLREVHLRSRPRSTGAGKGCAVASWGGQELSNGGSLGQATEAAGAAKCALRV